MHVWVGTYRPIFRQEKSLFVAEEIDVLQRPIKTPVFRRSEATPEPTVRAEKVDAMADLARRTAFDANATLDAAADLRTRTIKRHAAQFIRQHSAPQAIRLRQMPATQQMR
jgi:hypothetical protein